MDQELDDRKKKILKAIIKTYMETDISYSPTPQPEEFLLIKVIAST